jgi:hypothetical protein
MRDLQHEKKHLTNGLTLLLGLQHEKTENKKEKFVNRINSLCFALAMVLGCVMGTKKKKHQSCLKPPLLAMLIGVNTHKQGPCR